MYNYGDIGERVNLKVKKIVNSKMTLYQKQKLKRKILPAAGVTVSALGICSAFLFFKGKTDEKQFFSSIAEKSETSISDRTNIAIATTAATSENKIYSEISEVPETSVTEETTVYQPPAVKKINGFPNAVQSITASSQLSDESVGGVLHTYSPLKVIDNDFSTCWSEGNEEYGTGESITIQLDDTYSIDELTIWNGLCTNEDLYYKNSRLNKYTLIFSDGETISGELNDGWDNRRNVITFSESKITSSLTIVIDSVYQGNKYKDTCISEIVIS